MILTHCRIMALLAVGERRTWAFDSVENINLQSEPGSTRPCLTGSSKRSQEVTGYDRVGEKVLDHNLGLLWSAVRFAASVPCRARLENWSCRLECALSSVRPYSGHNHPPVGCTRPDGKKEYLGLEWRRWYNVDHGSVVRVFAFDGADNDGCVGAARGQPLFGGFAGG